MSQTGNQASGDRRPIAARQIPVFAAMAAALARWRVRPNLISIFGMLAAIVAGVCLALTNRHFRELTDGLISPGSLPERSLFFLAAGLVQLRLLANMLDGMVAVEGNMRSPTGDIYNEAPDRISDVAVLVGAGYAVNSLPALGYLAAVLGIWPRSARCSWRMPARSARAPVTRPISAGQWPSSSACSSSRSRA
jgi:phosphatidylglycerophosphate synthase